MLRPNLSKVVVAASLLIAAHGLEAHGPTLAVDKAIVAAGDMLTITGEGLSDGRQVELTLQGLLQDYRLPVVERTDEHGRFERSVTLPANLAPGPYTLIASGTETATVKIDVTGGAPAAPAAGGAGDPDSLPAPGLAESAEDHHSDESGHEHSAEAAGLASDEAMEIDRSESGPARAAAWGSVVVAMMAGFVLLRGSRR